jgi:hypothetical protein
MHDDARRQRLAADGLPPPEILDAWEVPDPSPESIDHLLATLDQPPLERPMHATPRRPFFTSVALGFLVAAGLLLSFWLGRRSAEQPVVESPAPEVQPAVAAACPEPPPPAECPAIEIVPMPIPVPMLEPAPKPRKRTATPPTSSGLKNPFAEKASRLHIGTGRGAPPAKVFIDGKPVGSTPLPNREVTAGKHTVRFEFPDGKVVERRVDVEDGKAAVVRAGG